MAVFRVKKTKDFTVMSNYHLRDKRISLKAKGLLSVILSLPENWNYTLSGLAKISKEKVSAIRTGILELEEYGYIERYRIRNKNGQLKDAEYIIHEQPVVNSPLLPKQEEPILENQTLENPTLEEPMQESPIQLNTNKTNTEEMNKKDFNIWMDRYSKTTSDIKEQIEYDSLIANHDPDLINNIVNNAIDNILAKYVILKLWHEFLVQHKEVNSIANTMRRKVWEQIGFEYGKFADRMLVPFEKKFVSAEDVADYSSNIRIETLKTDKSIECIYTFDEDILPMYIMYLTELARRGKHIRTCEICGRQFVASRKDTRVCSTKCKAQRQAGYFQEHKEKAKDDTVDKIYQRNRDGYDNFLKKLDKIDASEDIINQYKEAKYAFLNEGKKKRKAYRDGKLAKGELLDWIRADRLKRMELEMDSKI